MGAPYLRGFTRRDFFRKFGQLSLQLSLSSILLNCVAVEEKPVVRIPAAIDSEFEPAYLRLHRSGELTRRAETLWEMMERCRLCPRR